MEQIRFSFGLCAAATAVQMRLQDSVHLVYFHPFPLNSQLPQSQNSVPLLLKLGYINKSRLHINSCSCTHSNSKFALIWKCFFFPLWNEVHIYQFYFSHLWTDFKPLHNRAGSMDESTSRCTLFTWRSLKHKIHLKKKKEIQGWFLNIHNRVPITERSWFVPPRKNAKFTRFNF